MQPSTRLEVHRDEILRRWTARARAFAGEGAGIGTGFENRWEERIGESFDQICVLIGGNPLEVGDTEVESKLFKCAAIGRNPGNAFSARLLACGRQAIGDVLVAGRDVETRQLAERCGNMIDYLQHMLRANVCRDCREANCCMRVEFLNAIPGGVNE